MEGELLKKLNLRGIKTNLVGVSLTDEVEYKFGLTTLKIIKDFANQTTKRKSRLVDYFIQNLEKYFKHVKSNLREKEISKYISSFSLHKISGEIKVYYNFIYNNLSYKAANIFIKFYYELLDRNPKLYDSKRKLLKNVKVDMQGALEIGSKLLKKEISINNFSLALSNNKNSAKIMNFGIPASEIVIMLIDSFCLSGNKNTQIENEEEGVWINWNSTDPHAFVIEVNKKESEINKEEEFDMQTPLTSKNLDNMNLEKINNNYKKIVKKNKIAKDDSLKGKLNDRVIKICHQYVFEDFEPTSQKLKRLENNFENPKEDNDLDNQLVKLNKQLETQNLELEMQKNIWKLVLNSSRNAIKNYRNLKNEIDYLENTNDIFMSLIDKNTDQWRQLFMVKNNHVDKLRRYKFLIAAILESSKDELRKDLKEFRFAHDENDRDMRELFGKKVEFDLHEYLTTVYKSDELGLNLPDNFVEEIIDIDQKDVDHNIHEKQDKIENNEKYDSLVDNFEKIKPTKILVDLNSKDPSLKNLRNNVDALNQMDKYIEGNNKMDSNEKTQNLNTKKNQVNKIKSNLGKIKKDLKQGRTKSQLKKREKDKKKYIDNKGKIDKKDLDRGYMRAHEKEAKKVVRKKKLVGKKKKKKNNEKLI